MDSVSSNLHSTGIADTKSAQVISKEVEDLCWTTGSLGWSSPSTLQHTVFFYTGLHFVLRGVQEQQELKVSQLVREPPTTVYTLQMFITSTRNTFQRLTKE